jgi:hypothetical protein
MRCLLGGALNPRPVSGKTCPILSWIAHPIRSAVATIYPVPVAASAGRRSRARIAEGVKKFPRAAGGFAQVSSKSGKNTSSMVRRRFVNPCS